MSVKECAGVVNQCVLVVSVMIDDSQSAMNDAQRSELGEALRTLGPTEVGRRLGLSKEACLRLAVGVDTQAGTAALAVSRLGRLR